MIDTDSTAAPSRPPQQSRGLAALLVLVLLFLPAGYVLSVGPACWMVKEKILSEQMLVTVYAPLIILADQSPTFSGAIGWYVGRWIE